MYKIKKEGSEDNDETEAEILENDALNLIRDKYKRSYAYGVRIKNVLKGLMIHIINITIVAVSYKLDINLINWVFFSLNLISFGMFLRSVNSPHNLKN